MPDTRKHRGPHPADSDLFGPAALPALRQAVADFSWLLTRRYAPVSSLKLVGDRYQLAERQRTAVRRASCSDEAVESRWHRHVLPADARGCCLEIDGFNLLTTIEAALAGGVILAGRDGCQRDMASMHGNYRKVAETAPAIMLIGDCFAEWGVGQCRWLFDSPVSNSGRVSALVRELAAERGWNWETQLVMNPDSRLIESDQIVVSADSEILDRCSRWLDAASAIIDRRIPDAWRVQLTFDEQPSPCPSADS